MAKEMYPGKRNSLDALCDRYGISNAHRTLHGALLDAELLAEVYLAMTRGQESLTIDLAEPVTATSNVDAVAALPLADIVVLQATPEELAEHEALLDKLDKEAKGTCVWRATSAAAAT
jgi:DNA polymerase-3 subunit epsilon